MTGQSLLWIWGSTSLLVMVLCTLAGIRRRNFSPGNWFLPVLCSFFGFWMGQLTGPLNPSPVDIQAWHTWTLTWFAVVILLGLSLQQLSHRTPEPADEADDTNTTKNHRQSLNQKRPLTEHKHEYPS